METALVRQPRVSPASPRAGRLRRAAYVTGAIVAAVVAVTSSGLGHLFPRPSTGTADTVSVLPAPRTTEPTGAALPADKGDPAERDRAAAPAPGPTGQAPGAEPIVAARPAISGILATGLSAKTVAEPRAGFDQIASWSPLRRDGGIGSDPPTAFGSSPIIPPTPRSAADPGTPAPSADGVPAPRGPLPMQTELLPLPSSDARPEATTHPAAGPSGVLPAARQHAAARNG